MLVLCRKIGAACSWAIGFGRVRQFSTLKAWARNLKLTRSLIGNLPPNERSTSVRPKPGMIFLPSFPCVPGGGAEKALAFKIVPPGAVALGIQTGCPGTRFGRREM